MIAMLRNESKIYYIEYVIVYKKKKRNKWFCTIKQTEQTYENC